MGPMRARLLIPLTLLALLVSACAEPKVSLSQGPREYVPTDYPTVLKRWTRDESLIQLSELENKLTVTATFESWDFRWAYVIRYAADYRLTVEQRRELLAGAHRADRGHLRLDRFRAGDQRSLQRWLYHSPARPAGRRHTRRADGVGLSWVHAGARSGQY